MGAFQTRWGIRCCQNCENRYPACHDHCKTYQNEKADYEEMKSHINGMKTTVRSFDRHHYEVVMHQHRINANKGKVAR